jgi:hypothetical protein
LDSQGLRKLAVTERLALQGYDTNFFDGCELTNTQSYMLNGMSIPVVKWLGEQIVHFDQSVESGQMDTAYEKPVEANQFSKFFGD